MSMGKKIKTFFAHILETMGSYYIKTCEHTAKWLPVPSDAACGVSVVLLDYLQIESIHASKSPG